MDVLKPLVGPEWLTDGYGNMMPLWFDGDCLPKLLIDDDSEESDDDYEDDDIAMNEMDDSGDDN